MSDDRKTFYTIEYARSSRSSCGISKSKIQEGQIRLGRNSPSPFHDGHVCKWYLPKAFFESHSKMKSELSSVMEIQGFERLRMEDQNMVRELLGEAPEEETPEMIEANARVWRIKESLARLSQKDMQSMLDYNGMPTHGGADSLKTRIADAMVHGRATCASCPTQDECYLKYNYQDGVYKCQTNLQFGKCGYEGNNVLIHKWKRKTPTYDPVLDSTEDTMERPRKKILKKPIEFYDRDADIPLKDMKFGSAGRLSMSVRTLKDLVEKNGGYYQSVITPDLDYIISTYTQSIKDTHKMQLVDKYELCVVTELLIERLLNEFGFDQSPYVLKGELPPIGKAKLGAEESNIKVVDTEVQLSSPGTIDTECKYKNGTVYKEGNKLYDVLLSLTDISDGTNKFYRMQLIKVDKGYVLFKKWGRTGSTIGGKKCTTVISLESATSDFLDTFYDKTGNQWNSEEYEKKQGKYFIVLMEDAESDDSYESIFSILEPKVKQFIETIFDSKMMNHFIKSKGFDTRKLPLSKLSNSQINKGYKILKDIEHAIIQGDEGIEFTLRTLSNTFFTILPYDFTSQKAYILNSLQDVKEKVEQLEILKNIQIAFSLMEDTQYENATVHPSDENYKKLALKLKPMGMYSKGRSLTKYLNSGFDPETLGYNVEVIDTYEVIRPDEASRFRPFKNTRPRKLLWHGTNLCNIAGILSKGLLVPPEDAPLTAHPFGKGISFTDCSGASLSACEPNLNPTAILLLCDVALGESLEIATPQYFEELPNRYSSLKIVGRYEPDEKDEIALEERVKLPLGDLIQTNTDPSLPETNQYLIYNESQCMIKYALTIKFTPFK